MTYAEKFASSCPLPLTHCRISRELYGTCVPVLDLPAARVMLAAARIFANEDNHALALDILEARADALARR